MSRQNIFLGKSGEEAAVGLLIKKGYKILARNYKSKFGEIDIIAKEGDTFCFIEVKTRRSDRFGFPQDAVQARKQMQISKAALGFLQENSLLDRKARFDVISVMHAEDGSKMDLIKDAFELDARFTY